MSPARREREPPNAMSARPSPTSASQKSALLLLHQALGEVAPPFWFQKISVRALMRRRLPSGATGPWPSSSLSRPLSRFAASPWHEDREPLSSMPKPRKAALSPLATHNGKVGETLAKYRKLRGLTQTQLAEKIGVTRYLLAHAKRVERVSPMS